MWITKNDYLSESEMQNNALLVASFFRERGWSDQAIGGVLGNLQQESTINPGLWQNRTVGSPGYGLFQYTPHQKYVSYCEEQGYGFPPDPQLDPIYQMIYMLENRHTYAGDLYIEYIPTTAYPLTYAEYQTSTRPATELAVIWLYNVERPLYDPAEEVRRSAYAAYWYDYITRHEPEPVHRELPAWFKDYLTKTFYNALVTALSNQFYRRFKNQIRKGLYYEYRRNYLSANMRRKRRRDP